MARLLTPGTRELAESDWIQAIWQQPVERIFWIYGVPPTDSRGGHRHHSCQMVLHCLRGSVDVYVQTPAIDQQFTLESASQYLFLDAHDWRLMQRFSPDAVLMVFASKPFETTIYYEPPYRTVNLNQVATATREG
ncbi:sugar 3,4-ketoisomerase [Spirosoma areae]